MATKGTIDPAFQAAPVLAQTSHDPLEFARRHNLQKFQVQRKKQEEQERNTAMGLHDLMLELKGWEDQDGFRELMADQDKIMNGFLELSRKGMNLVSPRTTEEITAYKAINDAHEVIKQKADTWATQKGVYDVLIKGIEADSKLPEDERKIEAGATMENIKKFLQSKSIFERGSGLAGLMVTRPDKVDLIKKITASKDFYEKPTQKQVIVHNNETGEDEIKFIETLTPEQEQNNIKRAGIQFETLEKPYKEAVKKLREADPELKHLTDKDYFATIAEPRYRKRFLERPVGGGGGGFSINFGGTQAKTTPGELQKNDRVYGKRNYNNRYEFAANKPLIVPTTGGFQYDQPNAEEGDGWSPITGGSDAEGTLLFYDPNSDVLVFRASQDSKNPWVYSNNTFAVPRKNIKGAEKLPLILPNGKPGTLKDILPKDEVSGTKKLPLPDNFWSVPYIPKSKK